MQYSPTLCNKDPTKKMGRTFLPVPEFELVYEIDFGCAIRGHHIYKNNWTPVIEETLICLKNLD